jgi:hypothetical protein
MHALVLQSFDIIFTPWRVVGTFGGMAGKLIRNLDKELNFRLGSIESVETSAAIMRVTAVLRAARVPLIKFRYGHCNVGKISEVAPPAAPPAATPAKKAAAPPASVPKASYSGPARPLGPNVTVVRKGQQCCVYKNHHHTSSTFIKTLTAAWERIQLKRLRALQRNHHVL